MGVLLMLMTIGGLITAVILFAIAVATKKSWLKKFVVGGVAVWFAFYIAMLLGFSLFSTERTIAVGDTDGKAFCGFYLDCHMHTAVMNVRRTKTIKDVLAKGEFYIVKVKVFSNAKRETLGFHTVDAYVVDAGGGDYSRQTDVEKQLPPQPDFDQRISPVESFEKEIVFDLPTDINNPRLDMREGYKGIDWFLESVLVDDEDSFLHKRNYFSLDSAQVAQN